MALYHFHADVVTRSAGSSVVASAAYRAGEKLHSAYYGEDADYTHKGGVICTEIFLPPNAPSEYKDRETLWNAVEKIEKHPQAQFAYTYDFALQNELTIDENIALARRFVEEQFVSRGMIVDFAVHAPDKEDGGIPNPHVHLLCPIRPLKENGKWGAKQHRVYHLDERGERIRDENGKYVFDAVPTTDWGKKETLLHWREEWANYVNREFAKKGLPCRIDHRTLEEQGIDRLPTIHEGANVRAMEAKGVATEKGDFNRWVKETGAALQKLRQKIKELLAWLKEIKAELSAPNEPTLMDYINEYYDGRNAGAWSDKAKVGNLQARADAYNFLVERKLYTVDDLIAHTDALYHHMGEVKDSNNRRRARVKEIDDLLRLSENYREFKPIYDQMNGIRFKKRREAFASEHERELDLFYMARRKLKPYAADNKLPVASWKQERSRLQQEIAATDAQHAEIWQEVKELLNIQKCVEDIRHRQRTQNKQHGIDR